MNFLSISYHFIFNEKDLIVFCSPFSKVVGSTDATGDQNKIRSFSFKYVLVAKSEYDFDS